MSTVALTTAELAQYRERKQAGQTFREQADEYSKDFRKYIRAAWPILQPYDTFVEGWHIDVIAEHLQAVATGEIRRLQVWVPPGSMKSRLISILWPTWDWTRKPQRRYLTASYSDPLAKDLTWRSRQLILSGWYQDRWGEVFEIPRGRELLSEYANDKGGQRIATTPGGQGTGRHCDIMIIDDPVKADAADATSENTLESVIQWYDGTLSTRFADIRTGVEVIVMQRLHTKDLAAHALQYGGWDVLCLPERYKPQHPFAYRGDPREPGELLWPERFPEIEVAKRRAKLGEHRAAGQLDQLPSAREGGILKRAHWQYYPRDQFDSETWTARYRMIVTSWDTAFKDKTTSDYVAGQAWGCLGADKFLLRITKDRMSLGATKRAVKEWHSWLRERFPGVPVYHLIEKTSNGVEVIAELKREIPGITPITVSVDKVLRAEAAEPTLESGNVWVPGAPLGDGSDYDPALTPTAVQELIESAAAFPRGEHDDDVDAFTQMVNWTNARGTQPSTLVVLEDVL